MHHSFPVTIVVHSLRIDRSINRSSRRIIFFEKVEVKSCWCARLFPKYHRQSHNIRRILSYCATSTEVVSVRFNSGLSSNRSAMSYPMSDDEEEEIDENRARIVYAATLRQHAAAEVAADEVYNAGYAWAGLSQTKARQAMATQHQWECQEHNRRLLQRQVEEQQRLRLQDIHRAKVNRFSFDNAPRRATGMDFGEMSMNIATEDDEVMHPVLVGHRRSRESWER